MAGTDQTSVDVAALRATVETLTSTVSRLRTEVSGLMASHDGGVYGEDYAADRGPAVRARFFEDANDDHGRRMATLTELVTGLEATMAQMGSIQGNYQEGLDHMMALLTKLGDEQKDIRGEVGALFSRTPSDRKDKTMMVTGIKGFDRLQVYTGDASQWKDWRFKTATWLAQTNPSFETLMVKLDQSELEPQEPEEGHKMKAGPKELTTEEVWCSEQLYQLLVQKTEGPALAIVRNLNTHGKARGLSAWYRTMRDAEGQVEVKKDDITEKVFYSLITPSNLTIMNHL